MLRGLIGTLLCTLTLSGCVTPTPPPVAEFEPRPAATTAVFHEGYFLDESIPIGLEEDAFAQRMIGRGVEQSQSYTFHDPYFINWVRIDREGEGLRFRALKARDRVEGNEPLSEIAMRAGDAEWYPVAAINADFWAAGGRPVGLTVIDGALLTLGDGRPAVAETVDGALHMDRFDFDVMLGSENNQVAIDDINLPANRLERVVGLVVAYTPESIHPDFGTWPPGRLEQDLPWAAVGFRDADGDRLNINEELEGELVEVSAEMLQAEWPEDLIVIVGYGDEADDVAGLTPGDEASLSVTCEQFPEPTRWAVGGGPILLHDGQVVVSDEGEPGFSAAFVTTRHPRSLIGWNDEEVILMVIDGRQPDLSQGMGLVECAQWMRGQGMTEAMNFDGGGSSSLWARGETASSPSDAGGERSVTDGLILLSNVRGVPPLHLMYLPGQIPVVDLPFESEVRMMDSGWNPLSIDRSMDLFEGATHVPFPVATWSLQPEDLEVVQGESVVLHPRAFGEGGSRLRIPRSAVMISIDPEEMAEVGRDDKDRLVLSANREGMGNIVFTSLNGESLAEFPLTVGHWEQITVEDFDDTTELPQLDLTRFDPEQTSLSWTTDTGWSGGRALAIDYAMQHDGTSAAHIQLDIPLPDESRRVGCLVHGDGGEAWLRGIITDADGERFLVDFTNGTEGVNWADEWRPVEADLTALRPHWGNPEARATPPYALETIYLAQTRESSKTSGRILFDTVSVDVFSTQPSD